MAVSGFLACIIGCIICSIISFFSGLGATKVDEKNTTAKSVIASIAGLINCITCLITLYFMLRSPPAQIMYLSPPSLPVKTL